MVFSCGTVRVRRMGLFTSKKKQAENLLQTGAKGVGTVICGATTREQVAANAAAADWRLSPEDLAALP